jgi:hypothetical protein
MKIVHEAEVKKLKTALEELKRELAFSDKRDNFSGVVGAFRKK